MRIINSIIIFPLMGALVDVKRTMEQPHLM